MINQALSLRYAGSRCVKAGNYFPGVRTQVPAGDSQAGQSCRAGLLGELPLPPGQVGMSRPVVKR